MISSVLRQLLKARRGELNARFQLARHAHPDLDGAAFLRFIEERFDRLVGPLANTPSQTAVFDAAFDLALDLFGKKLVGPSGDGSIELVWTSVFPPLVFLITQAPRLVLGSLVNASHQIATTPGARVDDWINLMANHGPRCPDVDALLSLGQLAAWRSGLAHFRQGALAAGDKLPLGLASAAFGCDGTPWTDIAQKFRADPWFNPQSPTTGLRIVAQVGAFRGFGGLFMEPPSVRASGPNLLVRSADGAWLLTADVFGATFHRAIPEEFDAAGASPDIEIRGGQVRWKENWYDIPFGNGFASCAATADTLALTSAASHRILLLALT